jgi:hypothetical protein
MADIGNSCRSPERSRSFFRDAVLSRVPIPSTRRRKSFNLARSRCDEPPCRYLIACCDTVAIIGHRRPLVRLTYGTVDRKASRGKGCLAFAHEFVLLADENSCHHSPAARRDQIEGSPCRRTGRRELRRVETERVPVQSAGVGGSDVCPMNVTLITCQTNFPSGRVFRAGHH